MKIPSKDVIQAGSPGRVIGTIDAVARGARDDKAIAAAIGGFDARQGRYYRRAAEVFGFRLVTRIITPSLRLRARNLPMLIQL